MRVVAEKGKPIRSSAAKPPPPRHTAALLRTVRRRHTAATMFREPLTAPRPASSEDEEPLAEAPVVGGGRMPASPLFRPSNLRCINTLSGHHSGIRAIAWRSNPQRVYTGSYDNTIKVWNLDSNICETTLEGHSAWVRSLFCHPHEPLLFSGSDDGEVKIWRTDNNTLQRDLQVAPQASNQGSSVRSPRIELARHAAHPP